MHEPVIRAIPTEDEFKKMVDQLIVPEDADTEAKLYAQMLLTVADNSDSTKEDLALAAARHAFTKTSTFEAAFRDWLGFPTQAMFVADRMIVEAPREM